jgi:nitrous-oxide reductase
MDEKFTPQRIPPKTVWIFISGLLIGALIFLAISPLLSLGGASAGSGTNTFSRPFPLPNQYWEQNQDFYVFASGGQQGGLYVYSIPAMKSLAEIPVFSTDESWGWTTEDTRIREMLTNPWTEKLAVRGDTRQVAPSRTDDIYDGRWLFTSDMLHPRIARVDLDTFRAGQVLWLPNINGGLGSLAASGDSSWLAVTFEHSQYPESSIRDYVGLEIDQFEGPYLGGFAGVNIQADGALENAWQVWAPWQQDAVRIGWGASEGWLITTSYNTERETSTFSMLGNEEDYIFFWNIASIEQALAAGKSITSAQDPDTPIIRWEDIEGYAVAVPTNPSGLDISPSGQYIFSGGKAARDMLVLDIDQVLNAIQTGNFDGDTYQVPVLPAEQVRATTLTLGLGPTHVEFDNRGYAYIGSFVDSVIWKVALGDPYTEKHGEKAWELVDTIESHYSIVHPMIPGGDTAQPTGDYLLAINKLAKNTFLPHGPLHNENHELFSISGSAGELIDQMALGPESHAARALPVSLIQDNILTVYPAADERETPRVDYDYAAKEVRVYMDVVRSFFAPNWFSVPQGWQVTMHLNSLEQTRDISHGLAIDGYDVAVSLDPGQVREVAFVAEEAGVHWFYCLWYCSELHKEMRGRMIVVPADEWTPEMEWN